MHTTHNSPQNTSYRRTPALQLPGRNMMLALVGVLTLFVLLFAKQVAADGTFTSVTGKRIEGSVLHWDAIEDAAGYNIYGGQGSILYMATTTGTSFPLTASGSYTVIAHDSTVTRFSPWLIDSDPEFLIDYDATAAQVSAPSAASLLAELGCGVNELIMTTGTGWRCVSLRELNDLLSQ